MITGPIKSQIDQIWNAFWSGGISNPIEVIEQITYLLFLRRLDDLHTLEENKSARLEKPIARRVFPEGKDGIGKKGGRPYDDLRWSRFKHFAPTLISMAGCLTDYWHRGKRQTHETSKRKSLTRKELSRHCMQLALRGQSYLA